MIISQIVSDSVIISSYKSSNGLPITRANKFDLRRLLNLILLYDLSLDDAHYLYFHHLHHCDTDYTAFREVKAFSNGHSIVTQ